MILYIKCYVWEVLNPSQEPEQPLGMYKLELPWAPVLVPIEPPVLTYPTRTQEQVETAFTWRSGRFCAEPTGSVLDSHWPREF